jgi:type II secretory ATPase GspE/PulE/Tfp pilus assembly ATPase PilB-like protein/CheY-like chemotaxis protein
VNAVSALTSFLIEKGILERIPDDLDPENCNDLPILALSEKGCFEEQQAIDAVAKYLGIGYVDLRNREVLSSLDVKSFAKEVRANLCWEHRFIPLYQDEKCATVAFANPFDYDGQKILEFSLSKPVKIVIAEEAKIVRLLNKHFPQTKTRFHMAFSTGVGAKVEVITLDATSDDPDKVDTEAAPIVRLTNKILSDAIKLGASDIHIEPEERKLDVRFRIDGVMQDIIEVPKRLQQNITARIKIISGLDISERRRPQDGRLRVSINDELVDMRVSSVPTSSGEKLVMRVLRSDYEEMTFANLGMSETLEQNLYDVLSRKGKLLLVSGPTGSGKTTTLYVCLNTLRDGRSNITTIEDPIEYRFAGLNQIQVNRATDVTFVSALRSVLRQDPDIIMIGEIRDPETTVSVLQAAQTGHLVLSTVHTNDAPSAVTRLLSLGADPYLLSTSLAGVLAQRLVRRICPECRSRLDTAVINNHMPYLKRYGINPDLLQEGRGCASCFYSGYRGRIGIYSYLGVTDEIADIIFSKGSKEDIVQEASKHGFQTLDSAAIRMLESGVTTFSEIRPYLTREEEGALPDPLLVKTPDNREYILNVPGSPEQKESESVERPHVLIVDDSKDVRKMLSVLLRKEMVDVTEAVNGFDALERIYENRPDIVVCDISMPEMDGREFLERVKSNKQTRDIPVIMLTVDDTEGTELELLKHGVRDFLSKSSSPMRIVGRIRNVLNAI